MKAGVRYYGSHFSPSHVKSSRLTVDLVHFHIPFVRFHTLLPPHPFLCFVPPTFTANETLLCSVYSFFFGFVSNWNNANFITAWTLPSSLFKSSLTCQSGTNPTPIPLSHQCDPCWSQVRWSRVLGHVTVTPLPRLPPPPFFPATFCCDRCLSVHFFFSRWSDWWDGCGWCFSVAMVRGSDRR